ncbi:something about silencing protein 10 [Iris pallida]|uniref:Something about silencing protein 10 n=1 Tax=Iris pallida TaxID=29817 RepID=A0AAX6ELH0_IRIPA|nr:something about silencing protein 10 [Iris pallida]KAJ6841965.1 something about silencing protein 10 [Iris pallida]
MAKGSKRPRTPAGKPTKTRASNKIFREEDIDDEVDAFHKQRDIVPLDAYDEDGDSDEDDDMEQPVFDFEDGNNDESDNSGSDGGEDADANDKDDGVDDTIQDKGFAAKIARQAKYLRQKFGGIDDDMDDDVEVDKEEKKSVWGRKKNLYYDADNVDYELQSSDEDPMEEEAEVVKIQREKAKFLSMEDFGFDNAYGTRSDSDGQEETFLGAFTGKKAAEKHIMDAVLEGSAVDSYEDTTKDLSGLTKEEQMEVVYSSAPELVALLAELSDVLDQLKHMNPFLPEVEKDRTDKTKGGMNFLEVKRSLLLAYCQAISFYLLLKSEGHSVREHPVKARLVEIKNLLEKAKEIGASISPQTEEIANHESETRNKVAEDRLGSEQGDKHASARVADSTAASVTVQLDKDKSKDILNKNGNKKQQDTNMGFQSMEMLKVRANLEAKLKQKGIFNMTNPKPVKDQNVTTKPSNQRLETFDDFADEVHGTSVLQSRKPSQLLATKVKRQKLASGGDDDLPKRDDIGERRRKFELRVLARSGTNPLGDDGHTGDEDDIGKEKRSRDGYVQEKNEETPESEDEFYQQVKKQRAGKLMAKSQLYSRTPAAPSPMLEIEEDGKRHISYQMEKNRGLTRHRKKLTKNPRKKYKIKHQKAVIRRKGQVRDIRKPTGPYGGEASGINANVSRSIRFKS